MAARLRPSRAFSTRCTYYRDELNERYQVVCMGEQIDLGESRKFSMTYLIGAVAVGAGAVYFYGRWTLPKEQECGTPVIVGDSCLLPTIYLIRKPRHS